MTPKALGVLLSTGTLSNNKQHVDKEFIAAYEWMMEQMKSRIVDDFPFPGCYPIWVWCKWEGNKKYPPANTLTYERMENPGGIYRVALNIPDNIILLSNFDTWHAVLNNIYLAKTEEELDKDDWTEEEIIKSWENIFNISDVSLNALWGPNELTIQGTVWQISADMVVKVEHFPHIHPSKKFLKNKEFWDTINSRGVINEFNCSS